MSSPVNPKSQNLFIVQRDSSRNKNTKQGNPQKDKKTNDVALQGIHYSLEKKNNKTLHSKNVKKETVTTKQLVVIEKNETPKSNIDLQNQKTTLISSINFKSNKELNFSSWLKPMFLEIWKIISHKFKNLDCNDLSEGVEFWGLKNFSREKEFPFLKTSPSDDIQDEKYIALAVYRKVKDFISIPCHHRSEDLKLFSLVQLIFLFPKHLQQMIWLNILIDFNMNHLNSNHPTARSLFQVIIEKEFHLEHIPSILNLIYSILPKNNNNIRSSTTIFEDTTVLALQTEKENLSFSIISSKEYPEEKFCQVTIENASYICSIEIPYELENSTSYFKEKITSFYEIKDPLLNHFIKLLLSKKNHTNNETLLLEPIKNYAFNLVKSNHLNQMILGIKLLGKIQSINSDDINELSKEILPKIPNLMIFDFRSKRDKETLFIINDRFQNLLTDECFNRLVEFEPTTNDLMNEILLLKIYTDSLLKSKNPERQRLAFNLWKQKLLVSNQSVNYSTNIVQLSDFKEKIIEIGTHLFDTLKSNRIDQEIADEAFQIIKDLKNQEDISQEIFLLYFDKIHSLISNNDSPEFIKNSLKQLCYERLKNNQVQEAFESAMKFLNDPEFIAEFYITAISFTHLDINKDHFRQILHTLLKTNTVSQEYKACMIEATLNNFENHSSALKEEFKNILKKYKDSLIKTNLGKDPLISSIFQSFLKLFNQKDIHLKEPKNWFKILPSLSLTPHNHEILDLKIRILEFFLKENIALNDSEKATLMTELENLLKFYYQNQQFDKSNHLFNLIEKNSIKKLLFVNNKFQDIFYKILRSSIKQEKLNISFNLLKIAELNQELLSKENFYLLVWTTLNVDFKNENYGNWVSNYLKFETIPHRNYYEKIETCFKQLLNSDTFENHALDLLKLLLKISPQFSHLWNSFFNLVINTSRPIKNHLLSIIENNMESIVVDFVMNEPSNFVDPYLSFIKLFQDNGFVLTKILSGKAPVNPWELMKPNLAISEKSASSIFISSLKKISKTKEINRELTNNLLLKIFYHYDELVFKNNLEQWEFIQLSIELSMKEFSEEAIFLSALLIYKFTCEEKYKTIEDYEGKCRELTPYLLKIFKNLPKNIETRINSQINKSNQDEDHELEALRPIDKLSSMLLSPAFTLLSKESQDCFDEYENLIQSDSESIQIIGIYLFQLSLSHFAAQNRQNPKKDLRESIKKNDAYLKMAIKTKYLRVLISVSEIFSTPAFQLNHSSDQYLNLFQLIISQMIDLTKNTLHKDLIYQNQSIKLDFNKSQKSDFKYLYSVFAFFALYLDFRKNLKNQEKISSQIIEQILKLNTLLLPYINEASKEDLTDYISSHQTIFLRLVEFDKKNLIKSIEEKNHFKAQIKPHLLILKTLVNYILNKEPQQEKIASLVNSELKQYFQEFLKKTITSDLIEQFEFVINEIIFIRVGFKENLLKNQFNFVIFNYLHTLNVEFLKETYLLFYKALKNVCQSKLIQKNAIKLQKYLVGTDELIGDKILHEFTTAEKLEYLDYLGNCLNSVEDSEIEAPFDEDFLSRVLHIRSENSSQFNIMKNIVHKRIKHIASISLNKSRVQAIKNHLPTIEIALKQVFVDENEYRTKAFILLETIKKNIKLKEAHERTYK